LREISHLFFHKQLAKLIDYIIIALFSLKVKKKSTGIYEKPVPS